VTSISRLYSRPELVSGVLGARTSDLQEATPLAELVIAGDLEELVGCLRSLFCSRCAAVVWKDCFLCLHVDVGGVYRCLQCCACHPDSNDLRAPHM
jgi:hypothetical protein